MTNTLYLTTAIVVAVLAVVVWSIKRLKVTRQIVEDGFCGLHYKNGAFVATLKPGVYWLIGLRERITLVDTREQIFVTHPQDVLTRDQLGVKATMVGSYRIEDAYTAHHAAQSFYQTLYTAAQLALRDVIADVQAETLLAERSQLSEAIFARAAETARRVGLKLTALEVRDVVLPADLKHAFAEVLRAKKAGEAALQRARGESAALRNLANAARLLQNTPGLLQLRTLSSIEENNNTTLVVGLEGALLSEAVAKATKS